jgi:large subunit ribosomal protein L29
MKKATSFLDLTIPQIDEKITETKRQLFESRFQLATNQLDNTAVFRQLRHQVAQLMTIRRQKQGDKAHA